MHPNADAIFDFGRWIEFLDKELEQLFPPEENEYAPKLVDKLAKVYRKDGGEEWILIHIEVQGQYRKDFGSRMFRYYYRILDKYDKPITAYAIFTESSTLDRPDTFKLECLGTSLHYRYNTYKISRQDEAELRDSNNPLQGMPLDKLEKLIEKQKNTDKPITAVYSNPIRDAFGSSKDIHNRRTELVRMTEGPGILLLEEYAEDEYVEPSKLSLVERLGAPMSMMVTFGPISSFTAEMRRIIVVMGPDNVMKEFKRRESQIPYEEGLTLKVLEQLHDTGIYSLMTADSIQLINGWRHEIMDHAKSYLDPWFELKDSNCGTALWLLAREKKAIEIPVSDLVSKQFPIINSSMEVKDTMLVNALKIGFGNGQVNVYEDTFKYLNDWLKGSVAVGLIPTKPQWQSI